MASPNISRKSFLMGTGGLAAATLAACSSDNNQPQGADQSYDPSDLHLVEEGKLTCVSDMANPPFSSLSTDTNEPVGFEVDLMAAIADRMGLESTWLPPTKFDTIIPAIQAGGKADVGVANITITDERKQLINFSDPYIDANLGIVTPKSAGEVTREQLNVADNKIAAQAGTTGEAWAQENLNQASIVALDDPVQALTGVSSGLYTAAIADLPVVSYLCSNSYDDLYVSLQIPTGDQYGIAVSKDNQALLNALNDTLQQIQDDGTHDDLEAKWFGQVI